MEYTCLSRQRVISCHADITPRTVFLDADLEALEYNLEKEMSRTAARKKRADEVRALQDKRRKTDEEDRLRASRNRALEKAAVSKVFRKQLQKLATKEKDRQDKLNTIKHRLKKRRVSKVV